MLEWKKFDSTEHINLKLTLFSGQVFQFKQVDNNEYAGVLGNNLIVLKQIEDDIFYLNTAQNIESVISALFNNNVPQKVENPLKGLRFLTNDVITTIFSFICSSNNNIKRITKMVEYLFSKGDPVSINDVYENEIEILPIDNETGSYKGFRFYKFPDLKNLIGIEEELRNNKFGYRAEYICNAAEYLLKNPVDLSKLSYEEARTYLMGIKGIGRKVADCICLISLRHFHVVPIDTHVLRYSNNSFGLNVKNLNNRNYNIIQEKWIEKYGEHAGIAQLYVFKASVDSQEGRKKIKSDGF